MNTHKYHDNQTTSKKIVRPLLSKNSNESYPIANVLIYQFILFILDVSLVSSGSETFTNF